MRSQTRIILSLLLGLGLTSIAVADQSVARKFQTCRTEAEVLYGNAGQTARVRLEDARKSGTELRLRVFPPGGESFAAFCRVDRQSGTLVSLEPQPEAAAARRLSPVSG
jgi:hypothetical protein